MRVMLAAIPFAIGAGMPAWRCKLREPAQEAARAAVEATPYEEAVRPRETLASPAPRPTTRVLIPEGAVIHALDLGQRAFLHCFQRAQHRDPSLGTIKVTVHLEIDPEGVVTSVTSDADVVLARCLAVVARHLAFPAPHAPAAVDTPLVWRP
jgi:hypothetical protein